MKVKVNKLIIGDEYYFDVTKESKGIFVGYDEDNDPMFYPTFNNSYGVSSEPNGTVDFFTTGDEYEEVE